MRELLFKSHRLLVSNFIYYECQEFLIPSVPLQGMDNSFIEDHLKKYFTLINKLTSTYLCIPSVYREPDVARRDGERSHQPHGSVAHRVEVQQRVRQVGSQQGVHAARGAR